MQTRLPGWQGLTLGADAEGPEDGPPVVLLHGGGQTRHSWAGTLRQLGAGGWRAYSVDLRGHGESDWPEDGDYSLNAFASDITAVAESFGRPTALVGASLGGMSSLVAVTRAADQAGLTSSLVLVDIAHRMEQQGRDRIGAFMNAKPEGFESLDEVADAIAAYNPHRPRPTDLSGLSKNLRQREDGRWVWHWDPRFLTGIRGSIDETRASEFAGKPGALETAVRSLTVPTLLVRGRSSDLLSEEAAQEFLQLVPHAEFADVAGAGHMVAGDRNEVFNQAILGFLDRHRPA
ncbi:MAG: alpha/beta hydrolase [Actinomycetota bacterium]|nr:alpha/beta hydrolase [Actinomycetota bacterium]